jgi:hypothetical protein
MDGPTREDCQGSSVLLFDQSRVVVLLFLISSLCQEVTLDLADRAKKLTGISPSATVFADGQSHPPQATSPD